MKWSSGEPGGSFLLPFPLPPLSKFLPLNEVRGSVCASGSPSLLTKHEGQHLWVRAHLAGVVRLNILKVTDENSPWNASSPGRRPGRAEGGGRARGRKEARPHPAACHTWGCGLAMPPFYQPCRCSGTVPEDACGGGQGPPASLLQTGGPADSRVLVTLVPPWHQAIVHGCCQLKSQPGPRPSEALRAALPRATRFPASAGLFMDHGEEGEKGSPWCPPLARPGGPALPLPAGARPCTSLSGK